jgi:ornithine cyclodeaminase/alanine dehydrogenase-like protein (mu-crystallin family)
MNARLESLVSSLRQNHHSITFIKKSISSIANSDVGECKRLIGSADIICTATPSFQPLFPGHYIKSGAHVNLIGSYTPSMMEIDKELVDRAGIIMVDSKQACMVEAGDLIAARTHQDRIMELGELIEFQTHSMKSTGGHEVGEYTIVEDKCQLVRKSGDVTMFKSVGIGIQDVAIACLVVKFAEENGIGTHIESYDVL